MKVNCFWQSHLAALRISLRSCCYAQGKEQTQKHSVVATDHLLKAERKEKKYLGINKIILLLLSFEGRDCMTKHS